VDNQIETCNNRFDHRSAVMRLEKLWRSSEALAKSNELKALADRIDAYESRLFSATIHGTACVSES
jgi:hypothetical protein